MDGIPSSMLLLFDQQVAVLKKSRTFCQGSKKFPLRQHSSPNQAIFSPSSRPQAFPGSIGAHSCWEWSWGNRMEQVHLSLHVWSPWRLAVSTHNVWAPSVSQGEPYLIGMCSVLVLGTIGSIRESLVATFMLTDIWLLSSVRSQVCFQVFESRVGLCATFKLKTTGKSGLLHTIPAYA